MDLQDDEPAVAAAAIAVHAPAPDPRLDEKNEGAAEDEPRVLDKAGMAEAAAGDDANALVFEGAQLTVAMFCLVWLQFQVHVVQRQRLAVFSVWPVVDGSWCYRGPDGGAVCLDGCTASSAKSGAPVPREAPG